MKRPIALAILGLIAVLGSFGADAGDPKPQLPRKATPFGIQTGPGQYTWLNEFEGKTVVVAFILTTCPHCQFTTGILNKLHAEYAPKGVVFIASASEPMAALHVADFIARFHPAFKVGYNDEGYISKFLGYPPDQPMFYPAIAMIDRNGIIRDEYVGEDKRLMNDIQEKSLRESIEKTMAAGQTSRRTPAPKATPKG